MENEEQVLFLLLAGALSFSKIVPFEFALRVRPEY